MTRTEGMSVVQLAASLKTVALLKGTETEPLNMNQGGTLCNHDLRIASQAGTKLLLVAVGLERQQLQAFLSKKGRGVGKICCMCRCSLVAM